MLASMKTNAWMQRNLQVKFQNKQCFILLLETNNISLCCLERTTLRMFMVLSETKSALMIKIS